VARWLKVARKKGVLALVYRPDIQGLPLNAKPGYISLTPANKRKYRLTNSKQLIKLLQGKL